MTSGKVTAFIPGCIGLAGADILAYPAISSPPGIAYPTGYPERRGYEFSMIERLLGLFPEFPHPTTGITYY